MDTILSCTYWCKIRYFSPADGSTRCFKWFRSVCEQRNRNFCSHIFQYCSGKIDKILFYNDSDDITVKACYVKIRRFNYCIFIYCNKSGCIRCLMGAVCLCRYGSKDRFFANADLQINIKIYFFWNIYQF